MHSYDSLTLLAWHRENKDFLCNARIQKIQQPDRKSIILTLRKEGVSKKLYINIDSNIYHMCFMGEKNESLREFVFAKQPPMFCMLLRKYLEGSKIAATRIFDGERIFEIDVEKFDEFSSQKTLRLTVELMGKHSNIILYNDETGYIIGSAHNIGEEKSRERQIVGGLPYAYPKMQNKKFIEAVGFSEFIETIKTSDKKLHLAISANYFHITNFASNYIAQTISPNYEKQTAFSAKDLEELYRTLIDYTTLNNAVPQINFEENFYILYKKINNTTTYTTVNEMVDSYFAANYSQTRLTTTKQALISKLNKDIRRYENNNKKLLENTKTDEEIEYLKLSADLIMANMYENIFHSSVIKLLDFTTNKEVSVDYDTTKTPVENANKYYKLYAKAKKAAEMNNCLIQENQNKIDVLKDYIYSAEIAENCGELEEIKNELAGTPSKNKNGKNETSVPSRYINKFLVYTGRNNRQNDFIYSKLSSPNDLWFHVLNQPGAHILIKVPKNRTVDNKTLLECAKLAKNLSPAATSGKTSVIYTKRQFIKRPPKTQAGYVTFKNETEIVVE